MRLTTNWAEVAMILVILAVALVNLVVYGGIYSGAVEGSGHDPSTFEDLRRIDVPGGSAPGIPGGQDDATPTAADLAEEDDSGDLPGAFIPNQGRRHVGEAYPLSQRVPFCTAGAVSNTCYASNPPTSGLHIGVQRGVRLESGDTINIPPDPNIYDFEIPREAIPHIQEHAGVFVGYNCESAACDDVIGEIEALVRQELSLGARVVMAPDSDLAPDVVALASWTRIDSFDAGEFSDDRVRTFIKAHSCRFDPEGFCTGRPLS
jgi:hypothetical protein